MRPEAAAPTPPDRVAEARVPPLALAPDLDERVDGAACRLPRGAVTLSKQFVLERGADAVGHRVISAVPRPAHAS